MWNAFVVGLSVVVGVVVCTASTVSAQFLEPPKVEAWAVAMVSSDQLTGKDPLRINYKSVARGQDVTFKFRLTNLYTQAIQVTNLATSCGCISWEENRGGSMLSTPIVIPSGKEATVTLRLDTIRHQGEQKNKKATITVVNTESGKPGLAEILVEGYIRSDVVLQPGSVNFGSVSPEATAEQHIAVNYAGRSDWRIVTARCNSPHLNVDVVEKLRGNGLVNYDVVVKLKETAPVGQLRDQLIIVTDDANNPQIPIQVDARIEPEYQVQVSSFSGDLIPGKPAQTRVFVRYTKNPPKPFKIEKLERTRQEETIKVEKSSDMRAFHQMVLTITPPNEPGDFEEEFFVTISGREEPLTFKVRGKIKDVPAEAGTP